jgi:glycosyltransferase involved in cell wall biosynthesis
MRTYGVNGGERQLAQLFAANDGRRFADLFIFVFRDDRCTQFFAKLMRLSMVTLVPFKAREFPSLRVELLILGLLLPLLQCRLIWTLWRTKSEICVAHGLQAALTCFVAAHLLRRVKFVYVHRGTKSQLGSHWLFKWLYKPFDMVAGVSQASAKSLDPLLILRRAVVLENGINHEEILKRAIECTEEGGGAIRIICVGRLISAKGQALIIEAFNQVAKQRPGCVLNIVGDGPDRPALERLVHSSDSNGCIKFHGQVSNATCLMLGSDIFVHASETEGLSNAVLEAMVLELASVVVDAPGVTECHIDGQTGFVVGRDVKDLAAKLLQLVDAPDMRREMGKNASVRARSHYSMQANLERYHALFEHALEA